MNKPGFDQTHLYIKNFTQLFTDNLLIEASIDVTGRWHNPVKDSDPLIFKDKPWEHVPYFTYSNYCVLRDQEDGLFKCWYEDLELRKTGNMSGRWFGACQCYAESKDGVNWVKPELDVRIVEGKRTNIVIGGDERGEVHSAAVVMDPRPLRPDEKFRMVYTLMTDGPDRIECAHSADGIHWTVYEERPCFGMSGDKLNDVSVMYYDDYSRCFVMNTRHHLQWAGNLNHLPDVGHKPHSGWRCPDNFALENRRRVWQCYSPDFIHWSEPVLIADVDDDFDNLDVAYYGMSQCKLGNLNLGFVGLFHEVDNMMETRLLISHDGAHWSPGYDRQPMLRPGGEGAWDKYMMTVASPPVEVGDELWFYYGGAKNHHDWWYVSSIEDLDHPETKDPEANVFHGLGRAVLRKDGFASLYANRLREGIVQTRPVISDGTRLVVNAKCAPGGYVKAEVTDSHDKVIPGFSKENCDLFTGDNCNHTFTWKGASDVPAADWSYFWRKIRFYFKDADIYSFTLANPAESEVGKNKFGG